MDNDKRKLTAKELKRKNDFEKLNSEMQQKGFKIKNMTINIRQANFLGPLSMLPFIALTFLFYYNVNSFDLGGISLRFVVAAFLLLPLTILHELIHGITWGFFAKNHFHSIDFGFIWSSFSPWEAKKQDLSYGMFSAMLTEESKIHIYKEYEEYLMAKEAAEKARIRKYSKGKTKSNVPK